MAQLTPYPEVNAVLDYFSTNLIKLLGSQLQGIYVIGSLALGAFDPDHSDIDFVVVLDGEITDVLFTSLRDMHGDFALHSPYRTRKIEAVYVTPDAFSLINPSRKNYPQLENDRGMFNGPLEDGWVFQCQTLREHALIVIGPNPRIWIKPVDRQLMFHPVAVIANQWLNDAQNDPTWIDWLRSVPNHRFVTLTLCRMLYSLSTGDIASKPAAACWAKDYLPLPWSDFVETSLVNQLGGEISAATVADTLAFIRYTFEQSQT